MGNFKQNKKFGKFGGGGRSDDRGGGGFDRNQGQGRSIMHQAVCTACGKNCEVPFRPTGDKPVYCVDCFRNKRGGEQRRPGGGDFNRFSRPESASQPNQTSQTSGQFEAINQKLDRILKILSPVINVVVSEPQKPALKKEKVSSVKKGKTKAKPKKKK